jgi:uncharacterized cupin superfamily protein
MRDLVRAFDEGTAAFEPYTKDGKPAGEIALLRQRNTENQTLFVGLYRCPHAFEGVEEYEYNDSMYILDGAVDVQASDGSEYHLEPGDMATFAKGQRVTFQQSAGFKKFFVMSE